VVGARAARSPADQVTADQGADVEPSQNERRPIAFAMNIIS